MPLKIAALTMVYNEAHFLPRWIRHYAAQFGAKNCTVVDHGSDDGSTDAPGVNVLRIPRSPKDNWARAQFIATLCASLLTWYDWVIYTDVDEMLVAEPGCYASLHDLLAASRHDVITAIGFNVLHDYDREPPIDPACPVSEQRRWVVATTNMYKPLAIRRPVQWVAGFHSSDAPIAFDRLFLFHLRYYDIQQGLARLRFTRSMPWAPNSEFSGHQRISDAEWRDKMRTTLQRVRRAGLTFDTKAPPISGLLESLLKQDDPERAGELYYRYKSWLEVFELWELPRRFVGTF